MSQHFWADKCLFCSVKFIVNDVLTTVRLIFCALGLHEQCQRQGDQFSSDNCKNPWKTAPRLWDAKDQSPVQWKANIIA